MATPDDMAASMIANLPKKTGKSLEEWLTLVSVSGHEKHGKIVAFLKSEYGMGHGFANLVAAKALAKEEEVDLVAAQYAGAKAELKPIHDAIVAYARGLGSDVELAPKKTSVSLRRKKQFALITPATRTRVDLGLALKGDEPAGRLEKGDAMCSHRVRLEAVSDFDDEVKGWMAEAYSRAG